MNKIELLEQQIRTLKDKNKEILAKAKEINLSNQNLQNKLESSKNEREIEKNRWQLEKNDLAIRIGEKDEELTNKNKAVRDLKDQLKELIIKKQEVEEQKKAFQLSLSLSQKELEGLKKISKEFFKIYSTRIKDLDQMDRDLQVTFRWAAEFAKFCILEHRKSINKIEKDANEFVEQKIQLWDELWQEEKTEKQNLIDLIRQKNGELDDKDEQLAQTEAELQQKNQQIASLTSQTEELNKSLVKLHQHYQARLTGTRTETIKLGEEANNLTQQLTQEENLVDLKDHRLDNLTQKIDHLTKSGQQKQKTIDLLTIQLGKDQGENKDLTELLTKREKEVEKLTEWLNNTQQKLERTKTYSQNRIDNLNNQKNQLHQKVKETSDQKTKALKKLNQIKAKLKQHINNLHQLNNKSKIKENYYQDQDGKLRQTIQELQQEKNTYLVELNELETDLNQQDELLINKNSLIANLATERDNYLTELNELDHDFTEQEQLLTNKNSKLANAINQIQTLENNLNEQNQDYHHLEAVNETKNQRIIQLANDINNLQDQLSNEQQNHQQARLEKDNLQAQLTAVTSQRDARPDITAQEWADKQTEATTLEQERDQARNERDARPDITAQEWNEAQEQLNNDFTHLQQQVKYVLEQYRTKQNISHTQLNTRLTNNYSITETWETYINNATTKNDLAQRKLNILNALATEIINKHVAGQAQTCPHSDYDNLKSNLETAQTERSNALKERNTALKDKENYQSQLSSQEQKIVQQLNNTFNLGLDKEEKDLAPVINKLKELINKPPLTFTDETIQQELEQAQNTILKLEKQLSEKTPFGENLETIKQLELTSLEELFKQSIDTTITQQIQQATSYQQVVATRQAFLQKHLESKQNTIPVMATKNELITPPNQPNKERIILISLLVVSLVSIGGLLVRLRNRSRK